MLPTTSFQNDSFTVKEAKSINILLSVIFFVLFFAMIGYNQFATSSTQSADMRFYGSVAYGLLIPAVLFAIKAFKNNILIEINETGIFYSGSLVTHWENFISIRYRQEQEAESISDDFVLLIEYFKPGFATSYITKIGLSNTQDKSEEEIIEAAEEYHARWKLNP
jgi:hypothetical protein